MRCRISAVSFATSSPPPPRASNRIDAALGSLVARHTSSLYRLAYTLTGDLAFAEDMAAHVLRLAHQSKEPMQELDLYDRVLEACRTHPSPNPMFHDLQNDQREALALAEGAGLDLTSVAMILGVEEEVCQELLLKALTGAVRRRFPGASSTSRQRAANRVAGAKPK